MPFPLMLAAGAGAAMTGGAAVGTGAAGSGLLGGLLFGGATSAGLLGAGGSFGLPQTMSTLGMGLGVAQAFGGSSQGAAPTSKVTLSPEGKQLEKDLFSTVKKQYQEGLMPPNLASVYMGKIKRAEAERKRAAKEMLSGFTTRRLRTGAGPRAALREGFAQIEGAGMPTKWRTTARQEEFRNALASLGNIRNIELQTGTLRAQSMFGRSLLDQMREASQGRALGDVAQYAAMLRYPT
jgi:hypothetical protein